MSETQVKYTEDDTFEALCRIPVAELERRFDVPTQIIRDNTRRRVSSDEFVRKAEYRQKWLRWFMGAPERVFLTDIKLYNSYTEEHWALEFRGSGWTAKSYQDYIEAGLRKKVSHNSSLDVRKFKHKMCVAVAGISFMLITATMGLPYIVQLLSGVASVFGGLMYMEILDKKYNKQKDFDGLI